MSAGSPLAGARSYAEESSVIDTMTAFPPSFASFVCFADQRPGIGVRVLPCTPCIPWAVRSIAAHHAVEDKPEQTAEDDYSGQGELHGVFSVGVAK
jgi:hypothetical protein